MQEDPECPPHLNSKVTRIRGTQTFYLHFNYFFLLCCSSIMSQHWLGNCCRCNQQLSHHEPNQHSNKSNIRMTQGQKQNVSVSELVSQTQGNGRAKEKWFNGNNTSSTGNCQLQNRYFYRSPKNLCCQWMLSPIRSSVMSTALQCHPFTQIKEEAVPEWSWSGAACLLRQLENSFWVMKMADWGIWGLI